MSEHEHPVSITDKRGVKKPSVEDTSGGGTPPRVEETTEARLARIGQAMVDGKRDTLTADDMEFFMANQESVAQPDKTVSVRHMFLVVTEHNGAVVAISDVREHEKFEVEEGTMASVDDMYAAVTAVKRDIDASVAARGTVGFMQQHAQALAEQQRKQATGLQAANGFDPRGQRRR